MLSPRLRRRLSELARTPAPSPAWSGVRGGHSATAPPDGPSSNPPSPPDASTPSEPPNSERLSADALTPLLLAYDPASAGVEHETEVGCCWHISVCPGAQLDDGAERAERLRAAVQRLGLPAEGLLLVDIETAGLTAAPLFLVGALSLDADGLMLTQHFARGYEEEAALLLAFSRSLAARRMVVTFNGGSFDLPYLRDRALYHRLPPPLFPDHLDLLPAARRQWRGILPNCRLQTLEERVCRRRRLGDISGSAIPQLYHDFVRTGSFPLLDPVFHHNALDLLTLAELLPSLLDV